MAVPAERQPLEPQLESILYPNHSRYAFGTQRERYAKIAAERYAVGASIQ
ncbi:hypothetical protein [Streptomyces sp. NPDC054804]